MSALNLLLLVLIVVLIVVFYSQEYEGYSSDDTFVLKPIYQSGSGLLAAAIYLPFTLPSGKQITISAQADSGSTYLILTASDCTTCDTSLFQGSWPITAPGKMSSSEQTHTFGDGTVEKSVGWKSVLNGTPIKFQVALSGSGNATPIAGLSWLNPKVGLAGQMLEKHENKTVFFSLPKGVVRFGYLPSGGIRIPIVEKSFFTRMGKTDQYWSLVRTKSFAYGSGGQMRRISNPPVTMIDTGTTDMAVPFDMGNADTFEIVLDDGHGNEITLTNGKRTVTPQKFPSLQAEFTNVPKGVIVVGIKFLADHDITFNYGERYVSFS